MFRQKKSGEQVSRHPGRTPIATVIGAGSRIDGTVECDGALRIDGRLSGNLKCGETVTIGETGYVEADVAATLVVIAGELHGNATATELIELLPTGKLYGDATAPRIALSEGATVCGRCVTSPVEGTPSAATPVVAPQDDDTEESLDIAT